MEEVWQREMKMMLSGKGSLELDYFIQAIGMSVASSMQLVRKLSLLKLVV